MSNPSDDILQKLWDLAQARKSADPGTSYMAKLHHRGVEKIAQKVGEEAVESVIAAMKGDDQELVSEAADLLFHLMVLLAHKDIAPDTIWTELQRREGISGIAEKQARAKD